MARNSYVQPSFPPPPDIERCDARDDFDVEARRPSVFAIVTFALLASIISISAVVGIGLMGGGQP